MFPEMFNVPTLHILSFLFIDFINWNVHNIIVICSKP